jgi:hypothetical protein
MSYDVFPLPAHYTLTQGIKFATYLADMGDGFEQRVNKNISLGTRGDGKGTTGGSSYKGMNSFKFSLKRIRHVNASTTEYANVLWKFYVDHLGNLTPFYFYNPVETETPDLTGVTVTGRYLVRFVNNNLSRDNFFWKLFNADIELVETRG